VRLRTRLFLLVGGVVAVAVALVTWTVSASARRSFETLDRQRTDALVMQFRREFASQREDVARRLDRLVATDLVQRTALDVARRGADYAPFVNEAASLAAIQGLDFLDLVADEGTIISSAQWPARFGYRHSWATAQRGANAREAFLQAVELPHETALGLVAVRAVPAGARTLYLAGGRRLDQEFLKSLPLPPGMRAMLYRNVEPEVSRQQLLDASGRAPQAAQLEPLIARVRQTGQESAETIEWPDGPEMVDAIPLTGPGGVVLGVLLVASSGRELAGLMSRIRWSGFGLGLLGVVVGSALSYVVASEVTRPVEQVADAARRVAAGDWNVHVDEVRASGEIGALAQAFDTMTGQLVEQRERLVQAERVAAWRELARRLAHELKNPLFPLRLTVDNLRRARSLPAPEFDEVFEESLTTLSTGFVNLNTVVGGFSEFAKMPAPAFELVSPNDVVERVVALFRAQIEAPGRPTIVLTLDLDPSREPIRADGEQLGRVVQNLLLNAIDAMPRGGQLVLRTRRSGTSFRLDVVDTGEGLTDEERQRLFTPYYTTKQHGTGLGLAIVQSVVADHLGKVWVESTPGRGTTFHIELPAGDKAMPREGEA
jgi:two-component system, NtrC family, nitrogen regulation sensor histidine kinase NtrY